MTSGIYTPSENEDGGPAFPHDNQELGDRHRIASSGMSLRDYFAAAAMQGLLTGQYSDTSKWNLSEAPAEAYRIADAMLDARKP
jgi:hypothetical protein